MRMTLATTRTLQNEVLDLFERALIHGLDQEDGLSAYREGAEKLDKLTRIRAQALYGPLLRDPLTRDYVGRLDQQVSGLTSRIDVLKARITLALDQETPVDAEAEDFLALLRQRLRVLFRREATLEPIFSSWLARQNTHAHLPLHHVSPAAPPIPAMH